MTTTDTPPGPLPRIIRSETLKTLKKGGFAVDLLLALIMLACILAIFSELMTDPQALEPLYCTQYVGMNVTVCYHGKPPEINLSGPINATNYTKAFLVPTHP